jgi:hypothetical protein
MSPGGSVGGPVSSGSGRTLGIGPSCRILPGAASGFSAHGLAAFAPHWGHLNALASAASHITPVTMNGNRSLGICRVAWTRPWSGQRPSRVWTGLADM